MAISDGQNLTAVRWAQIPEPWYPQAMKLSLLDKLGAALYALQPVFQGPARVLVLSLGLGLGDHDKLTNLCM
jgi:hypothetical protein